MDGNRDRGGRRCIRIREYGGVVDGRYGLFGPEKLAAESEECGLGSRVRFGNDVPEQVVNPAEASEVCQLVMREV